MSRPSAASFATEVPPAPVSRGYSPEWSNRGATEQATRAAHARQRSGRWRFVDPSTCDRDYAAAELEFMNAIQAYRQASGRMFPTWSEVLEVLQGLGYQKVDQSPEGENA